MPETMKTQIRLYQPEEIKSHQPKVRLSTPKIQVRILTKQIISKTEEVQSNKVEIKAYEKQGGSQT